MISMSDLLKYQIESFLMKKKGKKVLDPGLCFDLCCKKKTRKMPKELSKINNFARLSSDVSNLFDNYIQQLKIKINKESCFNMVYSPPRTLPTN